MGASEGRAARRRRLPSHDAVSDEEDIKHRQPVRSDPTASAPSKRPGTRQAAVRARKDMSHQSRQFESDVDEENEDNGLAEEERDIRNGKRDVEDRSEARRHDNSAVKNTNSRPVEHTPTPGYHALSARPSAPNPRPASGQPPIHLEDQVRLVLDIYRDVFGDQPHSDPARLRTSIPERWVPEPPRHPLSDDPCQHPPSAYEQYYHEVRTATTQFERDIPPPPAGYAKHSFHSCPGHNRKPNTQYAATSCSTPLYNPHNELDPVELCLLHDDRTILNQMQQVWHTHHAMNRLRQDNFRVYAMQVLWDVFELRRARVYIPDSSQTVRWFVEEMDYQARMERSRFGFAAPFPPMQAANLGCYHQPPTQGFSCGHGGHYGEVPGHDGGSHYNGESQGDGYGSRHEEPRAAYHETYREGERNFGGHGNQGTRRSRNRGDSFDYESVDRVRDRNEE
ncbi:hypothetical protein VTI74DRAFT_8455 [Chaetomium olivicolor]